MNLSKIMKQKRDAEERLRKASPVPVYVVGAGPGGSDIYITVGDIINQITNVITDQLIAGDNITITDNLDGTYTITGQATSDLMFDGGSANSNDFTITFDGGGA